MEKGREWQRVKEKWKRAYQRYDRMMEKQGFYVVLAVCVLVIGLSAFYTFYLRGEAAEEPVTRNEQAESVGSSQAQTLSEAQELVTGGGTAGVRAALAAAERGSRTVLVEFFAHCGGTRTMGGVQLLYYGNRHRLFQKMWDEIDGFSRRLNGGQVYSRFGAAEALLYGEKIRQLGVEYDPCCLACGVEAHDGRIDGVLFVDEERVFTVCARNVVDATGDGDLARLAGIPMETGDRATGGIPYQRRRFL